MKCFMLFVVICTCALCAYSYVDTPETQALMRFYEQAGGKDWIRHDGWHGPKIVNYTENPCKDWYGLSCAVDGIHIGAIIMPSNNIIGYIPAEITAFEQLSFLDLSNNSLTGFYSVNASRSLMDLNLRNTKLSGNINISNFQHLSTLALDNNHFTGSFNAFCTLKEILYLSIIDNDFYGPIPDCLLDLRSLKVLQIGGNKFEGQIPDISTLTNLRSVDMSRNKNLAGAPVDALATNPYINDIIVYDNKFSGTIQGYSNHQGIFLMDIKNNNFTGDIPKDYVNSIPNLLVLSAQNNNIYGYLPWDIVDTTILSFDFTNNELYCPLPKLPPWGFATCGLWSVSSSNPDHCVIGEKCDVAVYGQGFEVGQKAFCVFGDVTTVAAHIESSTELHCKITPSKAGKADLFISVYGLSVTTNSIPFEFVSANMERKHLTAEPTNVPEVYNNVSSKVRANPVKVRLHCESKCYYSKVFAEYLVTVTRALGPDVVDIDFGFIMQPSSNYPTGYTSTHGQAEVIANSMILCVQKMRDTSAAMEFYWCMLNSIDQMPSNAAQCAQYLDLDYSQIRQCVMSDSGKQLLDRAYEKSVKDVITWTPTFMLNGEVLCMFQNSKCKMDSKYGKNNLLRSVCKAYQGTPPEACQNA